MEKMLGGPEGGLVKKEREKVSPHSEQVIRNQTELQSLKDPKKDWGCFAADLLNEVESVENNEGQDFVEDEDWDRHTNYLYQIQSYNSDLAKESFRERVNNARTHSYAVEFFNEALVNPDLADRLRAVFENPSTKKTVSEISTDIELCFGALEDGRIDTWLWWDLLKNHRIEFLKKKKEIIECIPEFKKRLRTIVYGKIKKGEIPIFVGKFDQTFETLTFDVSDGIDHLLENNLGEYQVDTHRIVLGAAVLDKPDWQERLFETFVHEVFHALSGKTVVRRVPAENFVSARLSSEAQYDTARSGVYIQGRFQWLDEAITETLAIQCSAIKDTDSYADERKLLEFLMRKYHIPFLDFLNAYFEDYEIQDRDTAQGAIAGWKELYKIINEKCGTGFLLKLDKDIQKRGIEAVLKELG